MNATKRPLFGNGTPFNLTATTAATAQTIFQARGVNDGWDEPAIFVSNTAANARTLFFDIGGTGIFSRIQIAPNTSLYRLLPSGREALVYQAGAIIRAYASASGLQITGTVVEVAADE